MYTFAPSWGGETVEVGRLRQMDFKRLLGGDFGGAVVLDVSPQKFFRQEFLQSETSICTALRSTLK